MAIENKGPPDSMAERDPVAAQAMETRIVADRVSHWSIVPRAAALDPQGRGKMDQYGPASEPESRAFR